MVSSPSIPHRAPHRFDVAGISVCHTKIQRIDGRIGNRWHRADAAASPAPFTERIGLVGTGFAFTSIGEKSRGMA